MRKNKEMENISFFLLEAERLGVKKTDLFQVTVISYIFSLSLILFEPASVKCVFLINLVRLW